MWKRPGRKVAGIGGMDKQQGYDLYWHKPNMYNPNNYEGLKENIFTVKQKTEKGWIESYYVSQNMLCLPVEDGIVIEGFEKCSKSFAPKQSQERGKANEKP